MERQRARPAYRRSEKLYTKPTSGYHVNIRNTLDHKKLFQNPKLRNHDTQHPDGTGGTAILIKNGIKRYLHGHYKLEHLQATSVTVEDCVGPFTIAAIYCPPKHTIKAEQFRHFYTSLGHRLLTGGD